MISNKNTQAFFCVRHEYAVVLFFILIWQAVLLYTSDGRFVETDNYTHALRLMDFIQSGSWKEILYRHDNCPFGQMLHFTRIMDMFLYVMTLPFLPFMELKRAILFGGFLYNPVMACLSAAALIWAGRAFLSPLSRAGIVCFYFITPFTASLYAAGRPDHHVLLNLLLIIIVGCLIYGAKTQKIAYYKTAGLFAGLSIWATPEGFLAELFLSAGMVTAWLARCQNIRQIRFFNQFCFICTALCLLVNPPLEGFLHPDNGRLSILIAVISGLASLSFYAEEKLEKKRYVRSFSARFGSLLLLSLFSLSVCILVFGWNSLFSPPISKELYEIWGAEIGELKSDYSGDLLNSNMMIFFDACILGCVAFFMTSFRIKKILFTIIIPLFCFAFLGAVARRFLRPDSVFAAFTFGFSVYIIGQKHFLLTSFKRTALASIFFILVLFFQITFAYSDQKQWNKQINDFVNYDSYIAKRTGCVLSLTDAGPEFAWETGAAVIGSPYHSNAQGIIDNYRILSSRVSPKIVNLLKKRNVHTIIVDNVEYYLENKSKNAEEDKKTLEYLLKKKLFFAQLVSGKAKACFLHPATDLPEEVKKKHRIYYVDFSDCDDQKTQVP